MKGTTENIDFEQEALWSQITLGTKTNEGNHLNSHSSSWLYNQLIMDNNGKTYICFTMASKPVCAEELCFSAHTGFDATNNGKTYICKHLWLYIRDCHPIFNDIGHRYAVVLVFSDCTQMNRVEDSHNMIMVQIGLQLFKWGHFHIFNLSYNLTSDDLWPWYMTFDLVNKWGFPCCTYDPTLVEIHQSMWKIETNVNPFSRQHQPSTDNNGQNDPYVSCLLPAKAGDTKMSAHTHTHIPTHPTPTPTHKKQYINKYGNRVVWRQLT